MFSGDEKIKELQRLQFLLFLAGETGLESGTVICLLLFADRWALILLDFLNCHLVINGSSFMFDGKHLSRDLSKIIINPPYQKVLLSVLHFQ